MTPVPSTPETIIQFLRTEFDRGDREIADQLVASQIDKDGTFTIIWTAYRGERTYGKTWNIQELHVAFSPNDAETLAGDIWIGEINEPNGEGHRDVERARNLVDNPEEVRWLGSPRR